MIRLICITFKDDKLCKLEMIGVGNSTLIETMLQLFCIIAFEQE